MLRSSPPSTSFEWSAASTYPGRTAPSTICRLPLRLHVGPGTRPQDIPSPTTHQPKRRRSHHHHFVFAGSGSTHTVDLATAWLLELKPGGRAYLTFNDEVTIVRILRKWPDCYHAQRYREVTSRLGVALPEVNFISIDQAPYASVFYNREFLYRIRQIVDVGFYWQAVYLLEK